MCFEALVMLFLLNDVVFRPDAKELGKTDPIGGGRPLSHREIEFLVQEMFSEDPGLAKTAPEKALKVIELLVGKYPEVNAAWFRAPSVNCDPRLVRIRYANVSIEVMASLYNRQERGALTTAIVDFHVWQRVPMRKMVTRA
jgi:hypothetical protein